MKYKITLLFIVLTTLCSAQIVTIPDANFKIKLLGASSSNLLAKNLSGNYFKIDANSDGEIQQSEANEVSELNMNYTLNGNYYFITSVVGITNFPNLTKLDLRSNRIVNLNITGLQFLSYIDCSSNNQYLTTLIIENLPALVTLYCQNAGSNTSNPVYSLLNLPSLKIINFGSCKFYSNTLDNITSLEEIYAYGGFKTTVTSIDLSNKPNLKIIELDNNNFSNITFFPNNTIETLKLNGSDLTIFNKTLFTNLKILDLSWNKLNGLDVSNMTTLLELYCDNASTSFTYDFTTLNVQGCSNLTKLICSRNVISNLNLSNLTNLVHLDCYGNNDVFTNTGLHTISLQNCNSLKAVIANSNPYITELDLSCSNNYTEIRASNCTNLQRINLKNGANESSMNAGVFSVYSSPNLNLVCVDFNEQFSFLPSTIQQSPYYNFTPNCKYNTVLGNVKFDIEGDGCQNNVGIPGIKIQYNCTSPQCYTFSDSFGNFTLYTQSNSVTLVPVNDLFPLFDFGLTAPITINFTPTNILANVDLCLAPAGIHNDLEVSIVPLNIARPGFDSKYKIIYKNKGNQVQSGSLNFTFDDTIMDLLLCNPITSSTSANALQWSFTNLLPFETREINLTFNINSPTETPPVNNGDILYYTATITGATDVNPTDNISNLSETVVNSFDPNNKICLEGATVSPDIAGKYVHYVINFENNGTANAQDIVVRDIIDTSKFDIATLSPISSSHNVYARVTNINEVEFIFENINLPFDNANNDGYIIFKIKTKSTLTVGNTFSNNASIYFDYNYPILTNTFISTIQTLGIDDISGINKLSVYPNPVKDILFFNTVENVNKVEVYDITGRILSSNAVNENKVNLSGLKTGNYILKVYTETGITNTKIIKE
ncbi:DUF7619 domain-containing protein [Flavobacterium sp.]|uniref:DUF7619 domain-containing protein n=1 Tax=Flavobacterium sp. TaxID=239 RepID=UPI002B4B880E|nr:T9SS type A sorting domain-containing protein [Flavobacterium sp.]HLF51028.1 T9SS type A sorting domain-containing protein [Flavobacterium sp.]